MKNIVIGCSLVLLDFTLNLGSISIDILPDFIGYILMVRGFVEMDEMSDLYRKAKPYAVGMGVYSGILFVMSLLGLSVSLGVLSYVLSFVTTVVYLYILYNIVMSMIGIEGRYKISLNGDRLKSAWTLLVISNILLILAFICPMLPTFVVIISIIAVIYFLIMLNQSRSLYYERIPRNE